jgi:hypothetical protein
MTAKATEYFAALRTDFHVFLQQCFHTLYPNKEFEDNWHIRAICNVLEDARRGKCPRFIINLPPRH